MFPPKLTILQLERKKIKGWVHKGQTFNPKYCRYCDKTAFKHSYVTDTLCVNWIAIGKLLCSTGSSAPGSARGGMEAGWGGRLKTGRIYVYM